MRGSSPVPTARGAESVAASSSGPVTCSGQQSPRRGERRGVSGDDAGGRIGDADLLREEHERGRATGSSGPGHQQVLTRVQLHAAHVEGPPVEADRQRPDRRCLAIVGDAATTRPRQVLDGHPLRQPVDGRCRPRAGVGAANGRRRARPLAAGRRPPPSARRGRSRRRPPDRSAGRPPRRGRSPSRSASAGSPSRKTSRSPTAPETASGSAPGRSTVAATAMPAAGPSTSTRSRRSATSPPSRSATTCRHAASPSTTRRTGGAPSAVRPSSRDASRSTRRATRSSSVRAITAPTWGRSASVVGQSTAVDHVDVEPGRRRARHRGQHGRRQCCRAATARSTDAQQVTGRAVPPPRPLGLVVRIVEQAGRARGQVLPAEGRRQRWEPGPVALAGAAIGRPAAAAAATASTSTSSADGPTSGAGCAAAGAELIERRHRDRRPTLAHALGGRRDLRHHALPRAEAQHGATRPMAGQRGRVGDADDVDGLGRVLDPEGDAEVRVGPDVVADGPGRALGGQHEVHAEAPAPLRHADERGHELGQVLREGGQLVDDDDEARDRHRPGPRPVGGEVGRAGRPQELLTAPELGVEAAQGSLGQALVEVRDDAGDVREARTGVERGAALVVDEHEGEVVGRRADREPGDERPQQLALARAGGPGRRVRGDRRGPGRPRPGRRRPPPAACAAGDRCPAASQPRRTSSGSVAQPAGSSDAKGTEDGSPAPDAACSGSCQPASARATARAVAADAPAAMTCSPSSGAARPVEDGRAVGSCLDDDVADAGERRGRVRDDQRGAGPVGGEQLADRRAASGHQRRFVHDEHQVRPAPSTRLNPAGEGLGKVAARRHQPVTGVGIAGVGQPAQPAPLRRARRRHGGHQEVGGAVGDGQLQDQAPRQRSGDRGWPDDAHDRAGAEVDGDRHVVERSRRLDERPPLVGHRVAARLQRRRLPAITAAHDGGERTRVVGPARPERRTRRSGTRHGRRELQCLGPQAAPRRPPGGTRDRRRRPRSRRAPARRRPAAAPVVAAAATARWPACPARRSS